MKTNPPCHPLAVSTRYSVAAQDTAHTCSVLYKVESPSGDRKSSLLLTANSDCLAKNSYDENKCQSQVNALYKCCSYFYDQQGDGAHTVSCPKASLLRLKMKQRARGV